MPDIKTITVTVATDPTPRKFNGRVAWALNELVAAGERGCTPITHPGPRWSGYVHRLRQAGINVLTHDEKHAGTYKGSHARYCLGVTVNVIERGMV